MIRRVLLACLAVSACSTAPQAAPPSSAPPTTAAPTTTAPISQAPTITQLQQKADRAAIPVDGMADYGIAKAEQDDTTPEALTLLDGLCGKKLGFTLGPARNRVFSGEKILLYSVAWSFQARTGRSVVDEIASYGASCQAWKDDKGHDHKLKTGLGLGQPTGVDAFFAYCDDTQDETKPFRYCSVIAARGDTVIEVATAGHATRKESVVINLRDVLPRAIDRLLNA